MPVCFGIFTGANAVDYSGYPDCRPEYLEAFERMANLATKRAVQGRPVSIRAPIVRMTKAGIVARGLALGVGRLVDDSIVEPENRPA